MTAHLAKLTVDIEEQILMKDGAGSPTLVSLTLSHLEISLKVDAFSLLTL